MEAAGPIAACLSTVPAVESAGAATTLLAVPAVAQAAAVERAKPAAALPAAPAVAQAAALSAAWQFSNIGKVRN